MWTLHVTLPGGKGVRTAAADEGILQQPNLAQHAAEAATAVARFAALAVSLFASWNSAEVTSPFHLIVMGMDGSEIKVEVCGLSSVLEVKMVVAARAGIPIGQQQLFSEMEGRMLTNKRWVGDFARKDNEAGDEQEEKGEGELPLLQMVVVQSAIQEVTPPFASVCAFRVRICSVFFSGFGNSRPRPHLGDGGACSESNTFAERNA